MNSHDFLMAPVWMAVNLLLIRAMWRTAGQCFPDHLFFAKVADTIVLCWACVAGVAIVLGLFGLLSGYSILGSVAIVALLVLWSVRRDCRDRSPSPQAEDKNLLDHTPERFQPACPEESSMFVGYSTLERWCWLVWGIWVAWCAGRVVVSGLLEFPSNFDTLTYHLPLVDQWLSTGSLYVPGVSKWFYPGNSEVVALWMVAPFSGDFFAPLNNFPAVLLLVVSATQLARLFGVAPLTAHLGVLALVSTYVVSHQLLDNKNDVAAVSLIFSYLVYSFRYVRSVHLADLVLAAMCLGLLAGVKYYALLYAGMGLVVFIFWIASCRGLRAALFAFSICLIGLIIWGGYWYGRNLWFTGTPVYPKALWPGGDLQTGANPGIWSTTLLGSSRTERWLLWLSAVWRMTGPCHLAALTVLPFSLVWLGLSGYFFRSRGFRGSEANGRWALMIVVLLAGLIYAITPNTIGTYRNSLNMVKTGYVTIRLGLCFFSLTVLSAIIFINDLVTLPASRVPEGKKERRDGEILRTDAPNSWHRRLFVVTLFCAGVAALAYQMSIEHRIPAVVIDRKLSFQFFSSVLVAEGLLIVVFLGLIAWHYLSHWHRLISKGLTVGALGIAAVVAGQLGERWHTHFASYYDQFFETSIFTYLKDLDPDSTRICVPIPRTYPFAGSRRQFPVFQANSPPAHARRFRSRQTVMEYLLQQDVTLIALHGPDFSVRTVEGRYRLGEQDPDCFVTIWTDDTYDLKRIQSDSLISALNSSEDTY